MYYVATQFDKDSWSKTGVNWLRKAKSAGLTGFIAGSDLPEEAYAKTKELGFYILPTTSIEDDRESHEIIATTIQKGQQFLFSNSDVFPSNEILSQDLVCSLDESLDLFSMITVIKNLHDRANIVRLIKDKIINVHGGLISNRFILGSWYFWNEFSAFQKYLHGRNYIDSKAKCSELIFNMYVALSQSISVKVIKHD